MVFLQSRKNGANVGGFCHVPTPYSLGQASWLKLNKTFCCYLWQIDILDGGPNLRPCAQSSEVMCEFVMLLG